MWKVSWLYEKVHNIANFGGYAAILFYENNFSKPGARPQLAFGRLWACAWFKNTTLYPAACKHFLAVFDVRWTNIIP